MHGQSLFSFHCRALVTSHRVAVQGSGKTLAFGLPILQLLLDEQAAEATDSAVALKDVSVPADGGAEDVDGMNGGTEGGPSQQGRKGGSGGRLRALVLAPTRELAMQARALVLCGSPLFPLSLLRLPVLLFIMLHD